MSDQPPPLHRGTPRFEETFIIQINSRNRISGTDSNFTYKIEFPPNKTYNRVCVTRIKIPKSYLLITEPDNYFILLENGEETKIPLQEGNVGRRDFVRLVQRNMNLLSPNQWKYTIDYAGVGDIDDGKLTFRVSNNNSQPSIIIANGLFELFGFNRNSTNVFEGNKLRSINQISFQAEDTLLLHSDLIKHSKRSVLQDVIATNGVSFSNIVWECPETHANCKYLDGNHELVSFTLTDEDDYPINLQGQNMVFTLLFFSM